MSLDETLQRRASFGRPTPGHGHQREPVPGGGGRCPFGGIGPSGMGHYHGREGFSPSPKAKTVLRRGRFSTGTLIHPYRRWYQRLMMALFLR